MRFRDATAYPNRPPRRPGYDLRMHGFALRGGRKILDYYQKEAPFHAQRLSDTFQLELRRIQSRPYDYPKHLVENLRKCVVKKHLIFFTIRSSFVVILGVRYGARRRPDKLLVKLANAKQLTVWPYRPNFRKDQFARPEKV